MVVHTQKMLVGSGLIAAMLSAWSCQKTPAARSSATDKAPTSQQLSLLDGSAGALELCGLAPDSKAALPASVAKLDNQSLIVTAPGDEAARRAVLNTLVAVPKPLLALFFAANGRIEIGASADLCKDVGTTDEERAIAGAYPGACWLAPQSGSPLRIVAKADPKIISASLVRLFAFVQVQYLVPSIQKNHGVAPFNSANWHAYTAGFNATRDQLADAFLADLKAANSPHYAARAAHAKSEPANFAAIAYADAVDSYYCSAKTRQDFSGRFKGAWKVFVDADNAQGPLTQLGAN